VKGSASGRLTARPLSGEAVRQVRGAAELGGFRRETCAPPRTTEFSARGGPGAEDRSRWGPEAWFRDSFVVDVYYDCSHKMDLKSILLRFEGPGEGGTRDSARRWRITPRRREWAARWVIDAAKSA